MQRVWDRLKVEGKKDELERRHSSRDHHRRKSSGSRRKRWSSEDLREASAVPARVATAYPAFSKAHSRESLSREKTPAGSREDVRRDKNGSREDNRREKPEDIPPSPPQTPSKRRDSQRRHSADSLNTRISSSGSEDVKSTPLSSTDASRVDYLLRNGGLPGTVRRSFMSSVNDSIQGAAPERIDAFAPFKDVLQDWNTVLDNGGSLAVATGYKSVARKLLDRLETVFARDIASRSCVCVLCRAVPGQGKGISWGEVLEWVGGRRQLPQWPPLLFDGQPSTDMAGLSDLASDVHVLDPDTPAEYRDHYLKQTKLTKAIVGKWMENFQESRAAEVDDETMTFAILTRLEPEKRHVFTQLLRESLAGSCLSLERLYRLDVPPRPCEAALFMLKHGNLHGVLRTLSEVNDAEWEILVSGRFDGFLWSGNEMATASTTSLPYRQRHGSKQSLASTRSVASRGVPVGHDEDTEIKTLALIEKDIHSGMEELEDAFEKLHQLAETVREKLRARRIALDAAIELRNAPDSSPDESEHDWEDDRSELQPDDSASMVALNRYRARRRTKAVAPVKEEDGY